MVALMKLAGSRGLWRSTTLTLIAAVALSGWATSAQRSHAEDGELKVRSLRVGKVLFLGNSITRHGPAPDIGWEGDWGMAASTREHDYVHLLLNKFEQAAGGRPESLVRNVADFERKLSGFDIHSELKDELAFEADVVILAIGENAVSPTTDEMRTAFADAMDRLLAELKSHGRPTIFVRSQFWADPEKDRLLKAASDRAGTIFVDLGGLGAVPENEARSERTIAHAGVGAHPGDRGMAEIAQILWRAIEVQSQPDTK